VSPRVRLLKTPGSPIPTASSCQDNSIRHTSPVGPSLGTTPSPEMHITVYRTISPLSVRSLSPLALDCYSPLPTPHLPFIPWLSLSNVAAPCHCALAVMRIERIYRRVSPCSLRLRAIAVSFSLRPLRIHQPCRWSHESQRASSSFTLAIRVVAIVIGLIARLSAILGATWVH